MPRSSFASFRWLREHRGPIQWAPSPKQKGKGKGNGKVRKDYTKPSYGAEDCADLFQILPDFSWGQPGLELED